MKTLKLLTVTGLLLLGINVTKAVELENCDDCTYSTKKQLAKSTVDNGEVIVYDSILREAFKFRVFSSSEPGFSVRIATPQNMSQDEVELTNALFDLYDEVGYSWKTTGITVEHVLDSGGQFRLNNVYDLYEQSGVRNDLSDYLVSNFESITSGNPAVSRALSALASALAASVSIEIQIDIVVKFPDGSQGVMTVTVNGSVNPEHDPDDSRNRDHENQEIVNTDTVQDDGSYNITSEGHFNDFRSVATGNTIWVGISGGYGSGGTMVCTLKGNILTCTYKPK